KIGFIGITCHWLTPKFETIDILLCCEKIPYPHTSQAILSFISTKLKEFDLEQKVIFAVSDNGANMIRAFKDSEKISQFKKLIKFFTTSVKQSEHLDQAQITIAKNKNSEIQENDLIRFIDDNSEQEDVNITDKTDETDNKDGVENEEANELIEISKLKLLRNISDVRTRWNSSYYSWQRLLELREAIEWLATTLPLQRENNA
ncbi:10352_t:CDS:2, partial [Ambispora gerdemannii]